MVIYGVPESKFYPASLPVVQLFQSIFYMVLRQFDVQFSGFWPITKVDESSWMTVMSSAIGSVSSYGANGIGSSTGGSVSAQIAALQRQLAALEKQLSKVQSSSTDDAALQAKLIQQQIAALQLKIAQLQQSQAQNAQATDASTSAGTVSRSSTTASLGNVLNVFA
jgi:hypothetical protein